VSTELEDRYTDLRFSSYGSAFLLRQHEATDEGVSIGDPVVDVERLLGGQPTPTLAQLPVGDLR